MGRFLAEPGGCRRPAEFLLDMNGWLADYRVALV